MSDNPHWEVSLARSKNMSLLDSLPYAFTLTPVFNRPGSFSMTMPLDDEVAYKVAKHATCVVCERNESAKWSGDIVSVARDPQAMTLSLTAIGWLDELNHRFVRVSEESGLVFTGAVGGQIVSKIIQNCNAQTSTSGAVWPTHLTFGSANDIQIRTRSYKRSQNYGSAVQELVDVENGLDIKVDPITRAVSTWTPTSYTDRKKAVFGYGVEPFNLINAPQNDDGSSTANRITAEGSGGVTVSSDDDEAILAHGSNIREDWVSVSNVPSATMIGAYANAEQIYRRNGLITYDLKPLPYGDVPRLYDDFELGDQVYLSVDAGALKVDNQGMRVFAVTLDVDAQGNEVITQIGTSPS